MQKYILLETNESAEKLGCWSEVVGKFENVFGYTLFGNFFLQDSNTGQVAILYTIEPELVPTNYYSVDSFVKELLPNEEIAPHLIRPKDLDILNKIIGPLGEYEVYIPEPYPFCGGDGSLESFNKGNVWVYADLVGQAQGIGHENT